MSMNPLLGLSMLWKGRFASVVTLSSETLSDSSLLGSIQLIFSNLTLKLNRYLCTEMFKYDLAFLVKSQYIGEIETRKELWQGMAAIFWSGKLFFCNAGTNSGRWQWTVFCIDIGMSTDSGQFHQHFMSSFHTFPSQQNIKTHFKYIKEKAAYQS